LGVFVSKRSGNMSMLSTTSPQVWLSVRWVIMCIAWTCTTNRHYGSQLLVELSELSYSGIW